MAFFLPVTAALGAQADAALSLHGARDDPRSVAALVLSAHVAWSQRDIERTERLCDEVAATELRLGTRPDAYILAPQRFLALAGGRVEEAIAIWARCPAIDRANDDMLKLAGDLGMLAFFRALNGDNDRALPEALEGMEIARRTDNPSTIAYCLCNLAVRRCH